MTTRRKIAVISGSRAEYGLLYWLMDTLRDDPSVEFIPVLTGMHVLPQFGNTVKDVEADGFIPTVVPMELGGDTSADMAKAIASVLSGMTDALSELKPDFIVLLGDRYETLASATAALCLRIPVAHIHGGERSEGNIDESIRHAITKMAHVHFTAADEFTRRIVQMGEGADNVHTVGALGLENLFRLELPSRADIKQITGLKLDGTTFVCTYHPVTLDDTDPAVMAQNFCNALDAFPDAKIILTGSNADAGGQRMNAVYKAYAAKNAGRVYFTLSLGHRNYLAALTHATAVIGNSSSGLIEVPSTGIPTVNIGDRQKGRIMGPSIVNTPDDTSSIIAAIKKALTPEVRALAARKQNPYFVSERPSVLIAEILKSVKLDGLIRKPFYDVKP